MVQMLSEVLSVITADYKKKEREKRRREAGGAREEHGEDVGSGKVSLLWKSKVGVYTKQYLITL